MRIQPKAVNGFLARLPAGIRSVLLYGPDIGKVRELARRLAANVVEALDDPFNVANLEADDIESDPARLADEAAAQSLTGGRRLVWLRGTRDGHAETIVNALDRKTGDTLILVEAGDIRLSGGLCKLYEGKRSDIASIRCYVDNARNVAAMIDESLSAAGIEIEEDARKFLVARLGGDRLATRIEMEKLVLLAGPGAKIDLALAVEAVGDSAALDLEALSSAAADGCRDRLLPALDRAFRQGESPVRVLRVAQNYFQRLDLVVTRVAAGRSSADAAKSLRPLPFFRTVESLTRQARRWSLPDVARALARLGAAEVRCKTTGHPEHAECGHALIDVARMAVRAGRRR